jgi:sugar lactone lactonase YvrE
VDNASNVYVAGTSNNTIRIITPNGTVTTLAGSAGNSGSSDGTGSAAQFESSYGVAVDQSNNVYVADSGNNTIRLITPDGIVATLAGLAGARGTAGGTGTPARFYFPEGVAADNSGNLYVADTGNDTIVSGMGAAFYTGGLGLG